MSQQDGALQRFDITSPTPTALDTVPLGFNEGRNGNDVVAAGGKLYVTQQDAGTVARVDLDALADPPLRIPMPTVPGTTAVGAPLNATELDGTLWVTVHTPPDATDRGFLVPIDVATDSVGTPIPMDQVPYGIVAAGDALWVTFDDVDQIGRVDVTTGEVETIDGFDQPLDILPVGDDLWVVNARADRISIVDPASMQIRRNVQVGFIPWKIAAGMGSVWVVNSGNGSAPGSVSRIDATTNDARALQDPIEVQVAPVELAVGGDRVFVANLASSVVSVLAPVSG
jgi:DNA-binding beta-propeller fold protein YncE